ncbi:ATP-binding protein [Halobacillus rhizosphaerae]|uniref:sensor histidine kinase n=1 Tax=Halobacillus rhizosphaerae TaxID=3064889 RepID=UPI00398AF9A7
MTIRKRLFISNAAMILMPIIMLILYVILLNLFFGNELRTFTNQFHQGWKSQPAVEDNETFTNLKKTASLHSEKLITKAYLDPLSDNLQQDHSGIVVRKENQVVYQSEILENTMGEKLPSFGNEGYNPMVWAGHHQYSIRQHDFFFKDGTKGSVYLINKNERFFHFARRFFPMIFIGIFLIVVLTNIILSYLMARRILQPVRQLSEAADKISEGNLDFYMESKNKDELGKLVNTFDDMRGKLKESLELREHYENNRKELIASISHDLKTPLTSIRGYVEGIQDGVAKTEDKLERYLGTIRSKAEYMDRLINELFLYSKLDLKKEPFNFEKVKISPFIEDYVEELKFELAQENVQVSLNVQKTAHAIVSIDRNKMIRVLNNILNNSVNYVENGKGRIEIDVNEQEETVMIRISDNGSGVSMEEISNIFNRFYRSDPSRSSKTGGSGLGLAIALQIIKAHGGEIWAENGLEHGLSIVFTLPKMDGEGESL